ncbi:MAG TPA: hypothetical protein VFY66_19655, partial [Anaerolineales bacterium]|nr:hypothetical protein [Anaerolineales bacterium]
QKYSFSPESNLRVEKSAKYPMLALTLKFIPLIGHVPNYHPRFRGKINFARETEDTQKIISIRVR